MKRLALSLFLLFFTASSLWATEACVPAAAEAQSNAAARRRARWRRIRARRQRRLQAEREAEAAAERARQENQLTPEQMADIENEAPPEDNDQPTATELAESELDQARQSNLDPELFGGGGDEDDEEEEEEGFREEDDEELRFDQEEREPMRYVPLDLRLGLRAFHRELSYTNHQSGSISPYALPIGAGVNFQIEAYPGAWFTNGPFANVGLYFELDHAIGLISIRSIGFGADDISYPTTAFRYAIGLRYRIVLDDSGNSEIGFALGYWDQAFRVERGDLRNPLPLVPRTRYQNVHVGLRAVAGVTEEARLQFDLAYLPMLAFGGIGEQDYFPNMTGHGLNLAVAFRYAVGSGFDIYAQVDAQVFIMDFAPSAMADRVVDSGVDWTLGGSVGVAWRWPPSLL